MCPVSDCAGRIGPPLRRAASRVLVSVSLLLAPAMVCTAFANSPGDKLLVVDCLLPAQVRQLGTGFTFLAPRRAIKTSGGDCEVRGGEYVASAGGNGAAALRVWLPQAEQGDKAAQTYVGEIFEKGLGAQPDYQAAATWYQKAAKQGYSRAMINLGFLYEKGLGVAKNPVAALNWYRQASGLSEAIRLDSDAPPDRGAELTKLRADRDRALEQLDRARQELEKERARSKQELDNLRIEQKAATSAGDSAATERFEKELLAKEAAARRRDDEFARLERITKDQQDRLKALEAESGGLKARLDESEYAAARARDELARQQETADRTRAELARLQREAQVSTEKGASSESALARIRVLETELARRDRELGDQRSRIAQLEQSSASARDRTQQPVASDAKSGAAMAGPSIQLIDPELVATSTPMVIPLRGAPKYRDVIGRVVAPAGLLSFTVDDRTLTPDQNGLFKTRVDIGALATKVAFVAVDRAGNAARMDFVFNSTDTGAPSVASIRPVPPGIDFGRYYALVIGNQKYTVLPALKTPEADATAISELLAKRYGFEVKTLLNATRYETLSELNRLRAALTEKDNLLVYYAGHGDLDQANQRGYWLPVDAEPNSDANWISSVAVTDILNAMTVKQAIVIADSCYAGALTRSSIGRLESGMSEEARVNWLKSIAKTRSRTVLTSGGVEPVLDGGGGRHSVFAQFLLRILSENTEILEAQRVYQELSARVLNAALKAHFNQRPEYGPMRFAGHESGDFLFVPRAP